MHSNHSNSLLWVAHLWVILLLWKNKISIKHKIIAYFHFTTDKTLKCYVRLKILLFLQFFEYTCQSQAHCNQPTNVLHHRLCFDLENSHVRRKVISRDLHPFHHFQRHFINVASWIRIGNHVANEVGLSGKVWLLTWLL